MKQHFIKSTLLAATVFSLAAAARADDPRPVPASGTMGLLGQTYASLSYGYIDQDNTSSHADDFRFDINQALKNGLDGMLSYDWTQGNPSIRQESVTVALRAFSTSFDWGKPYVEGGAGYAWEKVAGTRDDSFIWRVATGVEFQVAPAVTVTPYVKYEGTPSYSQSEKWDFGVKANYWVNSQWAVAVGIDRDDHQNTGFTVGTNFRF